MPIDQDYIDAAIGGAAVAVLWQASDATDAGNGFPISDGGNEYSSRVIAEVPYLTEAVTAFVTGNAALLLLSGQNGAQTGHDLILTANGHGAGFWDRGLDMPVDDVARAAYAQGPAFYLAYLAGLELSERPETVGDALTNACEGYSFEAEFAMDENGHGGNVTWLMVENVVLVNELAGTATDPLTYMPEEG